MRTLVRAIFILIGSVGIFWWMANDAQRQALLRIAGLANAPQPTPRVAPPEPVPEPPKPPPRVEAFRDATCLVPTRETTAAEKPVMYSWRDADGRLAYGDRAPAGTQVEDLGQRYRAKEQFVRLEFDDRGQQHGPALRSVIGSDVDVMGRILRSGLDLEVRQIDLKITLVSTDAELRKRASTASAGMAELAGYYQHGANAVTLKEQRSPEATRRVARHEASHAMMAGMYGATPLWLNEGLAEMMESLDLAGQRRSAEVHRRHADALAEQFRSFDTNALPDLFNITSAQWNDRSSEFTYARAWGMTHFLMSSAEGQAFIKAVLQTQLERPCQRLDSMLLADLHFSGGTAALARQWQDHARFRLWQPVRF